MLSDRWFQAAVSYSLMSPPRIGRRRILPSTGYGERGGAQPQRPMRPPGVVVGGVHGKHLAQVPLAEDQHPVGDLGSDSQHEAFGEAVRPRTTRRDLDHLDTRVRHDRVERSRKLTGPIADEEPKPS